MVGAEEYLGRAINGLKQIKGTQAEKLKAAGRMVAECIASGGILHIFGCGHSHILAEEIFYRAGGLACVNPILDSGIMLHEGAVKASQLERLKGYGKIVLSRYHLQPGEIIIVVSHSGRNPVPIEVALEAKGLGLKVIAITALAYYHQHIKSRHSSGKHLAEVADLVIDNCGEIGDASLSLPGSEIKIGPLSTILGAAIINAIIVEAAQELHQKGITPPIFLSGNLDGSKEHNLKLIQRYKGRIWQL
ncbi:Uncharacterized protein, contains SIS (Sugar ISomerase) phosphosugar binding domain [Thermanaeromonas toyohensis ToBE]|uniref:UPF0309 protein SAMN00808754_1849 n=1 Tax=Thermanaeromonas toyohensis ToBE TaxID=698762 RepID=A0A1W1VVR3_9FIRM|nr:SIS domain-containing protein [Thermanaeromonas toyohensis]SMB97428.1 Uncharacterized protein, contains SIS (Sugar ISomerase) phosphosugar binding domain [Thermanaeromonas toyohensis ToBE]